jgi:hypothetical protein
MTYVEQSAARPSLGILCRYREQVSDGYQGRASIEMEPFY